MPLYDDLFKEILKEITPTQKEIDIIKESKDIKGGVVIVGKTMASWGEVELVKLDCR